MEAGLTAQISCFSNVLIKLLLIVERQTAEYCL